MNALAGAFVLVDLSDARQFAGFAEEARAAASWAAEAGDEVVAAFAQEALAVVEQVRAGTMSPEDAAAFINEMLDAVSEASEPATRSAADAALRSAQVEAVDSDGPAPPVVLPEEQNPYAQDAAVVTDFVAGAREQLDEAEAILSARATGAQVDIGLLFRCFHTLKGIAGFLALDDMARIAHDAETELDAVRSGARELDDAVVEAALGAVDALRDIVTAVESRSFGPKNERRKKRRTTETVRVDAERLEGLLDALGELAVAEAEVAAAVARSGDETAIRSVERLQRIARDMHATATTLRMMAIGPTFRKMARVVHDMTVRSGKQVELTMSGLDTELDRTIIDAIADPLVHLLRNAVDHGIEPVERRVAAGKSEVGHISLSAFHKGGSVYIEVADDGRGIDGEALLARALELGIETDGMRPMDLIFRAGFSTAGEVTEVSGRGVGMDAVAGAVQGLRGQLDVRSVPGEGSTFSIRLPLTLAVIDGIVVLAGGERFIVPTQFVERVWSVSEGDIISTAGYGEALVLPEGSIAVVPATAPFGGRLDTGAVAVVLDDGESVFGLLVDEVIGQHSLVIKSLSGPTSRADGLAGAALMGDGRAALVVDPSGIARALQRSGADVGRPNAVRSDPGEGTVRDMSGEDD